MIKSFRNRNTEAVAFGRRTRALPPEIVGRARLKLKAIDEARTLGDLRFTPGNRLEALRGDREGQHSIRVNAQWRICFVWDMEGGDAYDVEIVDYHR